MDVPLFVDTSNFIGIFIDLWNFTFSHWLWNTRLDISHFNRCLVNENQSFHGIGAWITCEITVVVVWNFQLVFTVFVASSVIFIPSSVRAVKLSCDGAAQRNCIPLCHGNRATVARPSPFPCWWWNTSGTGKEGVVWSTRLVSMSDARSHLPVTREIQLHQESRLPFRAFCCCFWCVYTCYRRGSQSARF